MKKLLLLLILFANISVSNACDICGCGVGNYYLGIMPQFQSNFIGLRYRAYSFDSHLGHSHEGLFSSKEYFQSTELWARYYPTPRLRVLAFVPYHFNRQQTDGKSLYLEGLGDVSVLASYQLIVPKADTMNKYLRHNLWVGTGLKTNSGKYNYNENDAAQVANPNFQLGTGSWDFLLNLTYTLRYQKFGLNVDANYKINTTNEQKYRFGNRLSGTVAAFFVQKVTENFAVMPNIGIYAESSGLNYKNKFEVENTGGSMMAMSAGIETYFFKKCSLGFNFQSPIAQNLADKQIKAHNRALVHLTWMF
jgi:hypothetical protein